MCLKSVVEIEVLGLLCVLRVWWSKGLGIAVCLKSVVEIEVLGLLRVLRSWDCCVS